MKIIKKLKWFFLIILIAVIGVLLNENLVHLYISKSIFYSILGSGAALTAIAYFIKPARYHGVHKFLIVLTIGFLLIPYLSLIKGYSNIFAKDQAGVTAKEIRFKVVKREFKKEGQDVWDTAMTDRQVILYPGKNWVWLGRQEFCPLDYDRQRGLAEIEIDVFWDQNLVSQEHPDWEVPVPENNPEVIKSEDLGGGKYFITFFYRVEDEGPILKPEGLEPPICIYPDIGMDFIIGEDGRFLKNTMHLLLPEPIGEKIIEIPLE
ncbi:MAG: hypothetical protein Q8N58_02440 [bacterium]|nr:hypothetical protein [bacterium]